MLNNEYWEGRYRAEEKARELADKRVAFQLQGVYQQHANNIQRKSIVFGKGMLIKKASQS